MKKPLIILTGPTAVGKTELSIRLAESVNGEIISADSMQVYKHMDVGTAKITPEEMQGIRHHLIDILEPSEDFNVYLFKELAQKAIDEIYERGKIPVVTGGTGFYIQAFYIILILKTLMQIRNFVKLCIDLRKKRVMNMYMICLKKLIRFQQGKFIITI